MRTSNFSLGLGAVGLVILVTEGFNAVYGYSLGRYQAQAIGLAIASASIGIVNVYAPFLIARAWRIDDRIRVGLGLAVLAGCLAVGHFSIVGVMSELKSDRAAEREGTTETREMRLKRIAELEEDVKAIDERRSTATIEAETREVQRNKNLTWDKRRDAEVELAVAKTKAEAREIKQAKLEKLRDAVDGTVALVADTQASAMKSWYGGSEKGWQYATTFIPAILLQFISTFGLYLMKTPEAETKHQEERKERIEEAATEALVEEIKTPRGSEVIAHPQIKQLLDFKDEMLVPDKAAQIGGREMGEAYKAWCTYYGEPALPNNVAGTFFALLFDKETDGSGKRQYLGYRLKGEGLGGGSSSRAVVKVPA